MKELKNIKHFSGLSILRFLAASLVIFHHVEQYKHWAGMSSFWGENSVNQLGHLPVAFFFVLSGFLITYLLMKEDHQYNTINLKAFYMRRILRIWPLYFVVAIIAFFLLPLIVGSFFGAQKPDSSTFLSVFLFLPNLLRITFPNLVGANQLWSVGIEEQFYLIWPVLILLFRKRVILFLCGFIILKVLGHMILVGFNHVQLEGLNVERLQQVEMLYRLFPVEQMAIGGLGAAFLFYNHTVFLKIIKHRLTMVGAIIGLMVMVLSDAHGIFTTYLEGIVFTVLIMQLTLGRFASKYLENNLFKKLGDMSYGIYMWHTIIIALTIALLPASVLSVFGNWGLHLFCFVMSIITANFSFKYLEVPVLKLKKYFLPGTQKPEVKKIIYVEG